MIRALNEVGSSEDGYDSRSVSNQQLYNIETQEENLQAIYTEYLKLMSKSALDDGKNCLLRLFHLIKDLDENQASPVQKNLKYLTYKNLGDLFVDKIEFYIEALSIDDTDINLWLKTAKRAYNHLNDYVLARNCLEFAFKQNSKNWLTVDLLIDCYFILYDYDKCTVLCEHSLKLDQGYLKAHVILNEIKNKSKIHEHQFDYSIINHQLLADDQCDLILKRLEARRLDRTRLAVEDRLKFLDLQKNNHLELKINLKSDTLNQLGINLIRLYSESKRKEYSIDAQVHLIKQNEEFLNATNSLPSNELSNSDEEKSKSPGNQQNSSSKDDYSQQQQNSKSSSFPLEYIDKRRSSRVQSIQSKNTKDLDDAALLDRITSLFGELCDDEIACGGRNGARNGANRKDEQTPAKTKSSVDNVYERECFTRFIRHLDQLHKPTLLNIFQQFVHFNSTVLKHLAVPAVYKDIYAIYRHHNPLPSSSISFLQEARFESQEVWSILVANEIQFNFREVFILTELLVYLETSLDEPQFNAFLIRLFILRGVHETNLEFLEFAKTKLEQLTDSIYPIYNINNEEITTQLVKALICSQSINNLQKLYEEQKYDQLFELLTPELQLNDNDLKLICKSIVESKSFEKGVEIFASREALSSICFDTLLICVKKLRNFEINCRLVKKLLHIAKTQCTVQSWTILLAILMAAPRSKVEEEQILKYIELSHQYLGKKSRCNAHSGEYLLLVLEYLINVCQEDFDDLIWRCFFCLYGYSRKHYTFKPHCNSHVKMTWDNCQLIYTYVMPEDLPEFDTANKSNTISSETRDLLLQIIDLIPGNFNPKNYLDTLDGYLITGKGLEQTRNFQPHQITQDVFYLIADYFFKNKEFDKATQYFKLDICASHHRFDSWAALALIFTSSIEELILNDTPNYYDADLIYTNSVQAIRCFSNALRLDRENTKVWVEFGNFVYNIGSYLSKMKKTVLYFDLHEQEKPRTPIVELDKRIEEMFLHASYCFTSSLETDCDEEMWLHYYVLGKIAEKENTLKALHYYDLADKCLYLAGACYPEKINYYNQQHLSIEALEVHYRIHACALKSLLSGKKMKIRTLSKIKTYLLAALRSSFVSRKEKDKNTSGHKFDKNEHAEGVFNCLSDVVDLTIERVENRESECKMTIINLCIFALKRCLIRFQNHYRSYYRLAHYYFVIGNFQAARNILLNQFDDVDILTGNKTIVDGLFFDRKSTNFFNGIWR